MKHESSSARICADANEVLTMDRATTFPCCINESKSRVSLQTLKDGLPDINKYANTSKQRGHVRRSWSSPEKKKRALRSKAESTPILPVTLVSASDIDAGVLRTSPKKAGQRRGRGLERCMREDLVEPKLRLSAVRNLRTSAERQAKFSSIDTAQMRRLAEERSAHAVREASERAKKLLDEAAAKKRAVEERRLKANLARDQRRAEVYVRNALLGEIHRRALRTGIAKLKAEAKVTGSTPALGEP